jgi:ribosomal protein L11 methyltransferase
MAAAKVLGENVKIDAVDIDPESVSVTSQNILINGVAKNINVFQSNGYEKIISQYDLVFANILARPLMDMAEDLYKHLKPGGLAILSGFLNGQKNWVIKAHATAGLEFVKGYKIKEWSSAIVKRN